MAIGFNATPFSASGQVISGVCSILAQSAVASSVTGTTSLTTLATVSIPANTLLPNGRLRLSVFYNNPSGRTGAWTVAATFGGQAFFSSSQASTIGTFAAQFSIYSVAAGSQISPPFTEIGGNAANVHAYTLDMTQSQQILIQGQLATSTDTIQLLSYSLEILNP